MCDIGGGQVTGSPTDGEVATNEKYGRRRIM